MRKKNYKGAKCTKRYVNKCDDVCKTYDAIQYAYANLLSEAEEVKSFQVNVLLQGLEEGAYTSDFVITKADGRSSFWHQGILHSKRLWIKVMSKCMKPYI